MWPRLDPGRLHTHAHTSHSPFQVYATNDGIDYGSGRDWYSHKPVMYTYYDPRFPPSVSTMEPKYGHHAVGTVVTVKVGMPAPPSRRPSPPSNPRSHTASKDRHHAVYTWNRPRIPRGLSHKAASDPLATRRFPILPFRISGLELRSHPGASQRSLGFSRRRSGHLCLLRYHPGYVHPALARGEQQADKKRGDGNNTEHGGGLPSPSQLRGKGPPIAVKWAQSSLCPSCRRQR